MDGWMYYTGLAIGIFKTLRSRPASGVCGMHSRPPDMHVASHTNVSSPPDPHNPITRCFTACRCSF
jgi:hypothetical protein